MTNVEAPVEPVPVDLAVDQLAPDADAPYGYMIDSATGERRAKKRPGRQKAPEPPTFRAAGSPGVEELKAREPIQPQEDRSPDAPPSRPRGKRGRLRDRRPRKPAAPAPPFRAGPIASGVNRLYLKVGKLVRVMDHDIGVAIIATTRKEGEDDTTVGEAWEEIAKVNPRIRRFLLKAIEGGAWSGLFMAHAPIFLAILMKDAIRKHIPFMKLISALLEDDDDGTPSDVSESLGGLQPGDVHQMMDAAAQMMAQMGMTMPRSAGGAGAVREPAPPPDTLVITTLPESA